MTTTKTYSVINYDTTSTLDGQPSDELVEQSLATVATGAVAAYCDDGIWQYVPEDRVDFFSRVRGETVVTVYVQES